MTTARDMYNSKVLKETTGRLKTAGERVFYDSCVNMFLCNDRANKEITIKIHVDIYIDDRRGVEVSSFWYKDRPFALCCLAGRELEDCEYTIITDYRIFNEATKYLLTLNEFSDSSVKITDDSEELEELDCFYGYTITGDGAKEEWEDEQ